MSNEKGIIPRSELVKKHGQAQIEEVRAAVARVNTKLTEAGQLPVRFTLEDFGPNNAVRLEVIRQLRDVAGYPVVELRADGDKGTLTGFEVK